MPPAASQARDDDAELFDFLDEFARDAERGRTKRLAEYLARYPGHEEAIAREFVRLQDGRVAEPAPATSNGEAAAEGERRIGPYRLVRELGVGGQGAVWLCEDTRIARAVALKFMPSSIALLSADRRRRMQREAEVVSRLEHPSICPIYEAQIDHDPPYIAMRFVEGETLAAAITRARTVDRSGPLPLRPRNGVELRRVLLFVERAARALHAAHEAGVIHRDIKPGNVMLTREGEPVLLDFGQARDEHAELDQRTLSGEVFGTPMYMSPEQVEGSASAIDRRTDVWSLGALLFETLTLARPFLGETVTAVLMAIRNEPLPSARRMNAAIEEDVAVVLETALEKDLTRRYATALEFAEDLRRVREYEPIRARSASLGLKLRRWAQREPALAASSALIVGSLAIGLAWTLHLLGREKDALGREQNAKNEVVAALDAQKEALDNALARHLAGRSAELLGDDPAVALVLGLRAAEIAPCYQTRAALLPALDECRLARQLEGGGRLVIDMDLFTDSQRVLGALDNCGIDVWNLRSGATQLQFTHPLWPARVVRAHPSGAWFVTGGEDALLRVWDSAHGELLRELATPAPRAVALDLDESGEQLAVLSESGSLALLDPVSGAVRGRAELGAGRFNSVRFSEDGRRLLVVGVDHSRPQQATSSSALVLDALDARELSRLDADGSILTSAAFSPDGERVVTTSLDGLARIWRLADGALEGEPLDHGAPVTRASFSRDGSKLVSGVDAEDASRVFVWDLATRSRRELAGRHGARIVSIDICRDGRRFVSTSRDMVVQLWTLDGELLSSLNAWTQPIETRWTPDGERLVTLGAAYWLRVWWGENPPDVYSLASGDGPLRRVAFRLDGRMALTCAEDGTVRTWSTPRSSDVRSEHAPGAPLARIRQAGGGVTDALFSVADVVTLSSDGRVTRWDAESGELIHEDRIDGAALSAADWVGDVLGGQRLAVVSSSGRVHVFEGGCLPSAPRSFDDAATCCALSSVGRFLAVGRRDAAVRVYDLNDGALVRERRWKARGANSDVVAIDLRDDAEQLVAACADRRVRFFDLLSESSAAQEVITFQMRGVAYNRPRTRVLVTGSVGRAAMRLLKLDSLKEVRHEVYHSGDVTSGSFDPSGRYVLTTSKDGSALVREADSGEPFAKLDGHGVAVSCGAFSCDGGELRVISGAEDGVARVWPVDPIPAARARKPRELMEWEHEREKRLARPLEYDPLR